MELPFCEAPQVETKNWNEWMEEKSYGKTG